MGRAQIIRRFMESDYAKNRWPDVAERQKHARSFADAEVDPEAKRTGFFVDLSNYTFDTKVKGPTWIHAITVGNYDHPYYDNVNFDESRIQRFERSVKERYTGIDPDIDYEHKNGSKGGAAAGWVKDAKSVLTDDDVAMMADLSDKINLDEPDAAKGLWVLVDWTPPARESLANGEYRYFSPELADEWAHPKTGTKYQDVFFGGGITNRPFLKDLTPLNFSEALDAWEKHIDTDDPQEGDEVKLEDFLKLLGMSKEEACQKLSLSEDSTDEQIIDAAKNRLLSATDPNKELDDPPAAPPVSKAFADQFPEEAARMQKLEEENAANTAALLEAQTDTVILAWFEGRTKDDEGKAVDRALPPVVLDEVRDLRLSLSTDQAEKFDSIMSGIVKAGTIPTKALSSDPTVPDVSGDPEKQMLEEVKTLQDAAKEKGETLKFKDAVRVVAKANPDLAREWMNSKRSASGE